MLLAGGTAAAKNFTLSSPDGHLQADIAVGKTIAYSVSRSGSELVAPSTISMSLDGGKSFGVDPHLTGVSKRSVNESIDASFYKRAKVQDNFNELTLRFRDDYHIIFRAYDDGIAYRFMYTGKNAVTVLNEQAEFVFPADADAVLSYVRDDGGDEDEDKFLRQMRTSFENVCTYAKLSQWDPERLAFLPVVVGGSGGVKVCITEADLMDYPGMFLHNGDAGNRLTGIYAPYPKTVTPAGPYLPVTERENYIAQTNGPAMFPWRVIIVAENDMKLVDSDMVYKLATHPVGDFNWVKPGKVAWDWWNNWNLYGVDFKSGINNDTYKYFIDFASKFGIEYILLDDGWTVSYAADLREVVPQIDLEMLVGYAREKNVGVMLWAGCRAFEPAMDEICRHYAAMGIKGFKVDYMDRDDQIAVDYHRRVAQTAAKYGLIIDFHGTYKPTGLNRTWPNVLNFEGVHGMEQMKWARGIDQVTYDVTIPFVRQVAGPMDYTQGATRNAIQKDFQSGADPTSQGTRCRQMAQYVIFESPLCMLCDSPSDYIREGEYTSFIAAVPTVWEQTIVLNGEIAKYVTIARQKGEAWYIGSMTNWDARELELDLSFLGEGNFKAEVFRDGANADRAARDYKKEVVDIPADRKLTISMVSGGGWAARIVKR